MLNLVFRSPILRANDSDARLVHQAKAGDQRAFSQLMTSYEAALSAFVALRVGGQASDDVMQEIRLACWTGIKNYGGASRFKAWLYGIAVNKCADHHRSRFRNAAESLADAEEIPDERRPDRDVEMRESVRSALARIPDAQRQVAELYYFAQLTLPEIAAALKRNLNTVKYQFYRAHDALANELGIERS